MGHSEFGQLLEQQASHSQTIAGLTADVAYWRSRGERAEYARQALEHHNAALKQELAAVKVPAKHADTPHRIAVQWNWIDEAPVIVDGDFSREPGGIWTVTIDAVWLHGADISPLIDGSRRESLRDAVEGALEHEWQANLSEAA